MSESTNNNFIDAENYSFFHKNERAFTHSRTHSNSHSLTTNNNQTTTPVMFSRAVYTLFALAQHYTNVKASEKASMEKEFSHWATANSSSSSRRGEEETTRVSSVIEKKIIHSADCKRKENHFTLNIGKERSTLVFRFESFFLSHSLALCDK